MVFQVVLIGGIVGCYVVSAIADSMLVSAGAALPPESRERIFQRQAAAQGWLRMMDILGIVVLILGALWLLGVGILTSIKPSFFACFFVTAAGFGLICSERILHAWISWRAFREVDRTGSGETGSAKGRALNALLLVAVGELLVCGAVWGWLFTRPQFQQHWSGQATAQQGVEDEDESGNGGSDPEDLKKNAYIPEADARELLGVGAEHLKLLIERREVRSKTVAGERFVHRGDAESLKSAGIPSVDELKMSPERERLSYAEQIDLVRPLLNAGQKDQAVQLLCERVGYTPDAARDLVEQMAKDMAKPKAEPLLE